MSKKICAIYCIENIVNNKKYIGGSKNIKKRWNKHRRMLQNNIHHNEYLQGEYNTYGKDNFAYKILQEILFDYEKLKDLELYWISYYNSFVDDGGGYNLTRGEHNFCPSKSTIDKMTESQKGKFVSEETRQKMSDFMLSDKNPNRGRHFSEEARLKMSEAGKTKIFTEEHRRHISEANSGENHPGFGKPLQESTKIKISEAQRGEKGFNFGKQYTENEIEIISKGRQGIKGEGLRLHSSDFVGVSWNSRDNKWKSGITHRSHYYFLGFFDDEIDAAKAYNQKAIMLFGNNATLNIIPAGDD